MEVHFTPEQEAQLSQIANHAGKHAEDWLKDVALRAIQETARFRAAVREGVEQANLGELVDDEQVRLWLEQPERSRPASAGRPKPSATSKPFPFISKDSEILLLLIECVASFMMPCRSFDTFPKSARAVWKKALANLWFRPYLPTLWFNESRNPERWKIVRIWHGAQQR